MNKLQMSNAEIVASYKGAADPNKQIGILADLNACKKSDIKRILQDAGAFITDSVKENIVQADEPTEFESIEKQIDIEKKQLETASVPQKKKLGQWDKNLARCLYDEGKSDGQIAAVVGISAGAVLFWRRSQNLSANSRKRRPAAQVTTTNDSVKIEPKTEEKANDDAHVIADAIKPRKPGMTINQDFENAVKLMEAEHGLKAANKIIEDQKRSLIATHNKCHQLEEKLRAAEATAAGNPDLMRAVELTFDLLNKMWERI